MYVYMYIDTGTYPYLSMHIIYGTMYLVFAAVCGDVLLQHFTKAWIW